CFLKLDSLVLLNSIPLKVVEVGGNVTLRCPGSNKDGNFFYWYKQPLGHMLQTVATSVLDKQELSEQFPDNRFKFTAGDSQYSLIIKDIIKEDEATYFCQSGTAYFQRFSTGIYLAVNGKFPCNKTTSVQEGDTVNLHCSLLSSSRDNTSHNLSDYNVYWFRAGFGESHLNFIYTQKNRSSNRSCVSQLSKTIQDSSDTGIYYCAVVTCGKILFGEGTKVEMSSQFNPAVLVLSVLLACCVTLIISLIVYIKQKVFGHLEGRFVIYRTLPITKIHDILSYFYQGIKVCLNLSIFKCILLELFQVPSQ
uniref:Ig-like domain-containing protein n=1 Tax=Xiphophorus couchianus TaxID=32473 RepID=A0A3B5L1A4_9TELE